MALSILHSSSQSLYHAAGAMSLFPLTLGLIGLSNPARGLGLFGFGTPSTPEARKLGMNLMLFWVSRDIFMAATAFAAYHNDDRKTLGWIYIAGGGVAICDGVMSQRQIGKDAWKHLVWIPLLATMGGGLLGWFDGL